MDNFYDYYGNITHVRTYDYYGWGCIICKWTYNRITGSYSYFQCFQPYQYYQSYSYPSQYKKSKMQNKIWHELENDQPTTSKNTSSNKKISDYEQSENGQKLSEKNNKDNQSNIQSKPIKDNSNPLQSTENETSNESHRPLNQGDKSRIEIAKQNEDIISSGRYPITTSELITNQIHEQIQNELGEPTHNGTNVFVNNLSSIKAAINSYKHGQNDKICILNFADPYKPGGGYLNGRSAQEETICRQTLLYPTIINSQMYELNNEDRKPENSDIMQYSPDVYVIRDDDYELIENPFTINIISSSAVDNRNNYVEDANEIMENRIRKIIRLAAFKKNDVLILGTFGCGVFKNDTYQICQIFKKILIEEGMKDYFKNVIFPIITLGNTFKLYKSTFSPK